MSNHEAACSQIERFYRLCGHVEISQIHTNACISGRELRGYEDKRICWNVLPRICKVRYLVGNCLNCLQERIAPGRELATEPARNVQERGNDPEFITIGPYGASPPVIHSPQYIRELALEWRSKVEEEERVSRTVELKRERDLNTRKEVRRVNWENDWAVYCANIAPGVDRAKILDLTNDFSQQSTADDLLGACQPDADSTCVVCGELLSQPPGSDENEAPRPVTFLNGCRHEFHYRCIVEWLIVHNAHKHTRCPVCRAVYTIVLKNDYADPKFRWVEDRERVIANGEGPTEKYYQVAGHIEFMCGLNGNCNAHGVQFHPFLDEDRWGDHEGHY